MKIKTDDHVLVIAGKDRGKVGKVMRIAQTDNKVVVEKTNIRTKHVKKTQEHPGQIIKYEAPISVSNVMLICPSCKKTTRIGYRKLENGKKQRICKKCGQAVEKENKK